MPRLMKSYLICAPLCLICKGAFISFLQMNRCFFLHILLIIYNKILFDLLKKSFWFFFRFCCKVFNLNSTQCFWNSTWQAHQFLLRSFKHLTLYIYILKLFLSLQTAYEFSKLTTILHGLYEYFHPHNLALNQAFIQGLWLSCLHSFGSSVLMY